MKHLTLIGLFAVTCFATGARAADSFACPETPAPVTNLSYGSRYTADSKTRSDLDEVSDAEVNAALEPVEKFISALSRMANDAMTDPNPAKAACVVDWLADWADAGALSTLDTMNVKLSVPARFAGMAIALLEAETVAPLDADKRRKIVSWLTAEALATQDFFDNGAPKNAARNNLRAWAGLASAAIGRLDNNAQLLDWAKSSFELVTCQASPDGSLPLEMGRAARALNYQLHATAPLIVTAEILRPTGYDGYAACDGKLRTIADFSLAAAENPKLVADITGKEQTIQTGEQELEPYMLAWVEPFLRANPDSRIDALVAPLRPLAHAKLGGNLTKIGNWIDKLVVPTS
jgi:poly(beta-D-mannuronate) lyase